MWWAAREEWKWGNPLTKHNFDPKIDHSQVKGGAFVLPGFKICVDFEEYVDLLIICCLTVIFRCNDLVEISWQGKTDFHVTVKSNSPSGVNRWGTSIQVTAQGVNSLAQVWKTNVLNALKRPFDRIIDRYVSQCFLIIMIVDKNFSGILVFRRRCSRTHA